MIVVETEQLTDTDKILRFLNKDGLMKTLGIEQDEMPRQVIDMNPSFLLRSLRYYRSLESHRGDQYENEILTLHPEQKIPLSNMNLNPIFVSCWSYHSSSDLSIETTWECFPDSVAVIESTVGDINQIINWLAPTAKEKPVLHAGNWGSLRADFTQHGKIIYYSPNDHRAIYDNKIIGAMNCFFKRHQPYSRENEYRFMIMFGNHPHFAPESFCVRLDQTNYIKKIYLKKEHFSKDELKIINAYYGRIIDLI